MDNYGTGVSRVLDPTLTAYLAAIWQQGKPPCDAELNLIEQLASHWDRTITLRGCPSGWLGNETNPRTSFQTNADWSNWFKLGSQRSGETEAIQWATVNGWLIPVTGTRTGAPPGAPNNTDTWNKLALDPPPSNSGDHRTDFVFLEVWRARVRPNPDTTNKPGAAYIYRHGNVEGGMAFVVDDIKDPAMGFETTQRIQLQYRIRVVTGLVGLANYPDGFDPAVVRAKGAYLPNDPTAVTSYTFTNMRQVLGDPGLWRAGDGTANSLGTVDGYVYAIPICVVFRRNSVAWNGEPSQNLNGAVNRNPTAIDRTGVKTFVNTALTAAYIDDTSTSFALTTATDVPLPASPATPMLIRVGDELMRYSAISGTTVVITNRGALGTRAEAHAAGVPVTLESSRPDGLYADQIARTDILDLRHLVNPNGFDYQALLRANFDKLLRGDMHSTWKYTGAGPQGTYVPYQDVIGTAATLGTTRLDAADNIRQVFSDAATVQRVEAVVAPNGSPHPQNVGVLWTLGVTVQRVLPTVPSSTTFDPGDVLVIPVSQFKGGVPGADQDQIRLVVDDAPYAVELRIDGMPDPLPPSTYSVSPPHPTHADDISITLGPDFPSTSRQIYITFHVLYGPGRGLSRRPHSLQSICYYNPGPDLMVQQEAQPTLNVPLRVAWVPTWARHNGDEYFGSLPVTAEAYADLGSKTVVLTPYRRIVMPPVFRPMDGNSLWHSATPVVTGTSGTTMAPPLWTTTFRDLTANFIGAGVQVGDRIVFHDTGNIRRSYAIQEVAATSLTLDSPAGPNPGNISYNIYRGEGLMPTKAIDGVTTKWAVTDPLGLFSGTLEANAAHRNIYIELPRHLVPTWGEVWTPIQHANPDTGSFNEGVNFLVLSKKGTNRPNSERNYVPYANITWSSGFFTTWDFGPVPGPAAYNAFHLISGQPFAGMRKFTDSRKLGRRGLELPPFYGIARLYAVYEVEDFRTNGGSGYNPQTREYDTLRATNLLRQNLDGPTFWIELDSDGDSTFILNADAIDTSRCPNATTFDSGEFVVEASIFGFDRGTFDPKKRPRIVLARDREQLTDMAARMSNVGWGVPSLDGPTCVVPAPPAQSDKILVNYSRTPYQGDAWGSQSSHIDVGYNPGPLTTDTAWQLVSLESTAAAPYTAPKQLEVLASIGFATTMGTGRIGGRVFSTMVTDPSNPGGEDPSEFPPTSPASPRPRVLPAVLPLSDTSLSTEYPGCTAELPLGALFRDKDFRGGLIGALGSPLVYLGSSTPAVWGSGAARVSGLEQREVLLGSASCGSGEPGEVLVHVDGNDGNYGTLTNFRTFRGGSVFRGDGHRPGGGFISSLGVVNGPPENILTGKAMLVRNHVTSLGTEVSAGDELMVLIVTTAAKASETLLTACCTNGMGEGASAADLYRIEGHPLTKDNTMLEIDPNSVTLARKSSRSG